MQLRGGAKPMGISHCSRVSTVCHYDFEVSSISTLRFKSFVLRNLVWHDAIVSQQHFLPFDNWQKPPPLLLMMTKVQLNFPDWFIRTIAAPFGLLSSPPLIFVSNQRLRVVHLDGKLGLLSSWMTSFECSFQFRPAV